MADKIKVLTVDENGDMKEMEEQEIPQAVLDTIKKIHGEIRDESLDESSFLTQRDLDMLPPGPETQALSLRADELAGKLLKVMDESNQKRIDAGEQVSLLELVLALTSVCATAISAAGAPVDVVMDDLRRWTIGLTRVQGLQEQAESVLALHERVASGGKVH